MLVISGTRYTDADGTERIETGRVYTYSKRSPVGSQSSGDWVLELLDDAGAVLRSVRFVVDTPIDDFDPSDEWQDDGSLMESWWVLVEDAPAYSSYRIKQRSQVVLESAVSPCAPEVTVISPIAGQTVDDSTVTVTWSGYDADGDDLTYHVHYSSDGGETYSAVGVGLSETSEETSLEYLEGSSQARFRVIATDGTRSTTAESGLFTLVSEHKDQWETIW